MKLATFVLASLLAGTATASADQVLDPPGGRVYVSDPPQQRGRMQDGRRGQGKQLRRALMETFDVNGDGRLGPRERRRALKILRRIEGRVAAPDMRRQRARKFIRHYDMNRDGNVGPREMPPAAADKLRRFDRNGDGWVEPREYGVEQ